MKYIEHIIEPEKLLLSWQTNRSRGRLFVAELIRKGENADLVYLLNSNEFLNAESLGFEGYPGFSSNKQIYDNVLFAFIKRLPPRSRGDFGKYLDSLRIHNKSAPNRMGPNGGYRAG